MIWMGLDAENRSTSWTDRSIPTKIDRIDSSGTRSNSLRSRFRINRVFKGALTNTMAYPYPSTHHQWHTKRYRYHIHSLHNCMTDFRILRKCIVSSIIMTIRFEPSTSENEEGEGEGEGLNFNWFIIGRWEHLSTTLWKSKLHSWINRRRIDMHWYACILDARHVVRSHCTFLTTKSSIR